MSKATKILKHIDKTKNLTRKALVTFICNMNGREYQSGYYGTALSNLRYRKRITTDKQGFYHLTKLGKEYIDTPYKRTPEEKKQADDRNASYKKWDEERRERLKETPYEAQWWNNKATELLAGWTIDKVRYLKKSECKAMGFYNSPIALLLKKGDELQWIFPQSDDEGNDGGALAVGEKDILPVMRYS
jgi:hypothetical protein|tara:strand:+ start:317 stop:880 length:564 start_codon:yes stop_codon:yes gene_type:complete